MLKPEMAKIMLEALDVHAPANINWNLEKEWLSAIMKGFDAIEREVQLETKDT